MATVTVTETGISVALRLSRSGSTPVVLLSANSTTNVPEIQGRQVMDEDITALLTADQRAQVTALLDAAVAFQKARWNIP